MKLHVVTLLVAALFTSNALAAGAGNTGGGCYNLQIIASKTKLADMSGSSGHSLFVLLGGRTNIGLKEGDFQVLDRNGTDGSATFQLPSPDPTNSGITAYSVFMRLVGKPGSKIDMSTCGVDALGDTYCSEEVINMERIAGKSSFTNVSKQLLYVYADINADGMIDRVPLFDSRLQEYFWQVDSTGKMHAQLRFCPVSTNVN